MVEAQAQEHRGQSQQDGKKVTIWSASFVALIIVNFLRMMGQAISSTVIPLYAYSLGATAAIVGFVSGVFAVSAIVVRPFAGPAFDSYSKKKLFFIFGVVLAVAGYAYTFAYSIPMIIATRLVHGIGMGCTAPLGLALASDILPKEKMDSGISIYSISQSAALAIGPAFGIWTVSMWGYAITFIIMGTFLAACVVVVSIFVKEPKVDSRPPYQLKLSRAFAGRAMGMSMVLMFTTIAFSCTGAFLVIYGQLMNVDQIGLFFTINAVLLVATRPVFGRLSDKYGTVKIVVPTMIVFAISYVIIAVSTSLPMFILAAVVSAFGFGACSPLVQATIFKCVPSSQRGSASNTTFLWMDLGNLIGPYMGGMVVDMLVPMTGSEVAAYSGMWYMMIIPIAIALVLYLALQPKVRRYQREAVEADREAAGHVAEADVAGVIAEGGDTCEVDANPAAKAAEPECMPAESGIAGVVVEDKSESEYEQG